MTRQRIIVRSAARSDILRYVRYLLEQDARAAAEQFPDAVDKALGQLLDMPGMGAASLHASSTLQKKPPAHFFTQGKADTLTEQGGRASSAGKGTPRVLPVERVIEQVCQAVEVQAEELRGSGRRAAVSRARAGVAYLWLEWLGQSGPAAARALGVHPATIYEVARCGRQEAAYWGQLCADVKPEFPYNAP